MDKVKTFVIILNWNNKKDTLDCLKSLTKTVGDFGVILVDNGSKDGSPEVIKKRYPGIDLLRLPENTGFCHANNLGIKQAIKKGGENFILLNNDTIVEKNLILELENVAKDDSTGLVAPLIYYYSQKRLLWPSVGKIYFWIANQVSAKTPSQITALKKSDITFLSGCCILIKKEVIDKIGLLSENFFAYFEDTDFCYRAKKSGFKLVLADKAKLFHKVSRSSGGKIGENYLYYMTRNNWLFAKMDISWYHWPTFLIFFFFYRFFWQGIRIVISTKTNKISKINSILKGAMDAWKGRYGKARI